MIGHFQNNASEHLLSIMKYKWLIRKTWTTHCGSKVDMVLCFQVKKKKPVIRAVLLLKMKLILHNSLANVGPVILTSYN